MQKLVEQAAVDTLLRSTPGEASDYVLMDFFRC